ncbi:MAG: hypothetical protein QM809_14095 [Gordonia sp. (in: high G+C Gram-positive bacteria)]|uniref:hypothetical protein n=1 Tax=Gordonia sp. (in: high G+C Gram-positive bacteria) TaxID=84139 RepID=UPI0039E2A331
MRWREGGETCERRSTTPFALAREVAERLGGEPPDLEIVRPSLEDVYLDLVGDPAAETTITGTTTAGAEATR